MKYRVKPLTIDAIQWNGDFNEIVYAFPHCIAGQVASDDSLDVLTRIGTEKALIGDWVIRYNNSEFSTMSDEDFKDNYEKVE